MLARPYRDLLRAYLLPHWRRALVLAALLGGLIGVDLVQPQIVRSFLDMAQRGGALGALLPAAALYLGIALLDQGLALAEGYAAQDLGWRATNALRADLTRHCLMLDLAFHNAHSPGELLERLDGDVTLLANFFSRFVLQVVGNGLLLVGILLLLFREDRRIGLAMLGFSLLALLVMQAFRNGGARYAQAGRQAAAELFGFLEERLNGLPDIQTAGAAGYTLGQLAELLRATVRRGRQAFLVGSLFGGAVNLVFVAASGLVLVLAALAFRAGAMSLGTVYLVVSYAGMLRAPLGQVARQARDFQRAAAGVARVRELAAIEPAVVDGPGVAVPPGPLALEFRAVGFAYPAAAGGQANGTGGTPSAGKPAAVCSKASAAQGAPDDAAAAVAGGCGDRGDDAPADLKTEWEDATGAALRAVSFRLAPGRVLGLLGRTGSGKTTLARLACRLYDPGAGAVLLGGADLRRWQLAELGWRVGLVTQEVQLFAASLRDNLTLFDPSIPDARLLEALEELGMGEWYRSLPQGLDSSLQHGGGGISAGEAQLLAFARVFLRDPDLVILDEASSRLDQATEARLERAVDRLLAGRTAIVIAHRLRTLERADELLLLEDGRVAERGERAALAADPSSRYAALLRAGAQEEVLA